MRLIACLFVFGAASLFAEETQGLVYPKTSYYTQVSARSEGVRVENLDQIYVQFYLDPKLRPVLKEEQPITLHIPALDDMQFTGKIKLIDPRIDLSSGLFRIKVLIDNPDHQITTGMRALADFTMYKP